MPKGWNGRSRSNVPHLPSVPTNWGLTLIGTTSGYLCSLLSLSSCSFSRPVDGLLLVRFMENVNGYNMYLDKSLSCRIKMLVPLLDARATAGGRAPDLDLDLAPVLAHAPDLAHQKGDQGK